MKKKLIACVIMVLAAACIFAKDVKMYVTVQDTSIREKKSSLSKTVAVLSYSEEVIVTKTEGSWSYCYLSSNPGKEGWVSSSSLNKRKPSQYSSFSASADEIALAGRGISEEVENLYKSFGAVNYAAVDAMEAKKVSIQELIEFIKNGQLNGAE